MSQVSIPDELIEAILRVADWKTVYVAMRVNRDWSRAVFKMVQGHFGFERHQAIAFVEAVMLGRNVFLTGGPGTGKSYVTECITRVLKKLSFTTCVTAPTGIAAINVKGMTTTRFIGARRVKLRPKLKVEILEKEDYEQIAVDTDSRAIDETDEAGQSEDDGFGNEDDEDKRETQFEGYVPVRGFQKFDKRLKVLIIDEISMISDYKFQQIHMVVEDIHGRGAFQRGRLNGGLQLIMVGDFAQLPAIIKRDSPEDHAVILHKFSRHLFKSKYWSQMDFRMFELTVCKRSQHAEYAHLANELRNNILNKEAWKRITRTDYIPSEQLGIFGNYKQQGNMYEKIRFPCAFNFNNKQLDLLPAQWQALQAVDFQVEGFPIPKSLSSRIWIKIGCRIQLRSQRFNQHHANIANGSCGFVEDMTEQELQVRFYTSKDESFVTTIHQDTKYARCSKTHQGPVSSRRQFAIRVSHGITAHSAQGMTIHVPFMVQCNQSWESGQLLVMLSRASHPELMRLVDLDKVDTLKKPIISPTVMHFHSNLRKEMRSFEQIWYAI
jgi:hypothetical protein